MRPLPLSYRYADDAGNSLSQNEGLSATDYPNAGASAAIVTYAGNDGSQEMHVFFAMAWFDLESWPWAHYIMEWATQGIFQVGWSCVGAQRPGHASRFLRCVVDKARTLVLW